MSKTPAFKTVTVRVPATTANLGPGFDTLGMALSMWNRIRVRWGGPPGVIVHGEGEGRLRTDTSNLMYRAAQRLLKEAGVAGDLRIEAWQEVPLSRGLGSSACAIVGGIFAANAITGFPVPPRKLLELATELEGHPDNVAAALLGGCCVAIRDRGRVLAAPVPLPPGLQCVVFIPDQPMATRKARAVLGPQVSREDAVFNISRTALLVAGLAAGNLEYLELATQDRLHQAARQQIFPPMKQLFANALSAGARGVFLSGAGPTVLALTTREEHRAFTIGYEMADAADKSRLPGDFRVLEPSPTGAQVIALGVED